MAIKYTKAFDLMKKKGLTTYKIRKEKILHEGTLQNLRNNTPISTETIEKLCMVLQCQPGDLMEYIPEVEEK